MLYRVTVGRDQYLGTAEEVVLWMSRAEGAPAGAPGDLAAYMRGIRARLGKRGKGAAVDTSSPTAFLDSLAEAGLVKVEERPEASSERVDRETALGRGPIAYAEGVDIEEALGDGGDAADDAD